MTRFATLTLAALLLIGCASQRRTTYVQEHDRPPQIEQAIKNGEVMTGMTKADVRASWGAPTDINESYYEGIGAKTQWCYGSIDMTCVYFEGGEVTGWN